MTNYLNESFISVYFTVEKPAMKLFSFVEIEECPNEFIPDGEPEEMYQAA